MARGKISQSSGKLVDTWYYEYQGISKTDELDEENNLPPKLIVEGIKVPISLYIHKKFKPSDRPPLEAKEVFFTVECKEPKFILQGSDIEVLRAAMWEHLDDHFKVRWELFYLVEIRNRHPYDGLGTGMIFSYSLIWKGTAWDGSLLLKEHKYREEIIRPWPGDFTDNNGNVIACIPHNDENTRALEEFSRKIDRLRELLAEFLQPDQIMKTLSNLAGIQFLPNHENHK